MLENVVKERLSKFSLPTKPKSFGSEYYFPEDVTTLLSSELGDWMFKLAAWKGYALRVLSVLETEKSFVKNRHENKISKRIAQDSTDNKKITKDHALGQLILNDESFRQVREELIVKEAELSGLNQIIEIYTMQIEILSREISRRTLELKLMQAGISSND